MNSCGSQGRASEGGHIPVSFSLSPALDLLVGVRDLRGLMREIYDIVWVEFSELVDKLDMWD